jgi:hypothetical protein
MRQKLGCEFYPSSEESPLLGSRSPYDVSVPPSLENQRPGVVHFEVTGDNVTPPANSDVSDAGDQIRTAHDRDVCIGCARLSLCFGHAVAFSGLVS